MPPAIHPDAPTLLCAVGTGVCNMHALLYGAVAGTSLLPKPCSYITLDPNPDC